MLTEERKAEPPSGITYQEFLRQPAYNLLTTTFRFPELPEWMTVGAKWQEGDGHYTITGILEEGDQWLITIERRTPIDNEPRHS